MAYHFDPLTILSLANSQLAYLHVQSVLVLACCVTEHVSHGVLRCRPFVEKGLWGWIEEVCKISRRQSLTSSAMTRTRSEGFPSPFPKRTSLSKNSENSRNPEI